MFFWWCLVPSAIHSNAPANILVFTIGRPGVPDPQLPPAVTEPSQRLMGFEGKKKPKAVKSFQSLKMFYLHDQGYGSIVQITKADMKLYA